MEANLFLYTMVFIFYVLTGFGFLEILPNNYTHSQFWLKTYYLSVIVVFVMGYHGKNYFYLGFIPLILILTFTSKQSREINKFSYLYLFQISILSMTTTYFSFSMLALLNSLIFNNILDLLLNESIFFMFPVLMVIKSILVFLSSIYFSTFLFEKINYHIYDERNTNSKTIYYSINNNRYFKLLLSLLLVILVIAFYIGDIFTVIKFSKDAISYINNI